MGGLNLTAASFAFLLGTILVLPSASAEQAPVVTLKQPISLVGYSCSCKSCDAGLPCQGTPVHNGVVPKQLGGCSDPSGNGATAPLPCDGTPLGASTVECDSSSCDASGAGIGTVAVPCTRITDIACDAALPASDNTSPCSCSGGCEGQACGNTTAGGVLHHLWSHTGSSEKGSCGKCKRALIDCACLNLCRQQGYWLRADALMWWTPSESIPTLATSSPLGTPIDDAGVLGLASTTPLSSDSLFGDMRGGGRVRFGRWANCQQIGFESSAWILGNDTNQAVFQSDGNPALARPFNNVDPLAPGPNAQLIGFDGVVAGTLTINSSSEIFGGDAGIRKNLFCRSNPCNGNSFRVDGYAGYRHFRSREGIRITENLESTALGGPIVLGTTTDLFDDFQTRNEFHGGNVGVVIMKQHARWSSEIVSRVAFGNLDREVRIRGENTVTVPGFAPVTRPGGAFALPTNIGTYEDSDFAILPEFQLNLGYQVTRRAKMMVGYTFMYLGDLVRPGDVIDTNINGNLLDPNLPFNGPARPEFAWNDSEMWLMGMTLGVELNF